MIFISTEHVLGILRCNFFFFTNIEDVYLNDFQYLLCGLVSY